MYFWAMIYFRVQRAIGKKDNCKKSKRRLITAVIMGIIINQNYFRLIPCAAVLYSNKSITVARRKYDQRQSSISFLVFVHRYSNKKKFYIFRRQEKHIIIHNNIHTYTVINYYNYYVVCTSGIL